METVSVDIVIFGSGPAGQKAAIQAAKLKKSVIVIEKKGFLGGACLHSGTIPSKTLRAAILDLTEFYTRSFYSRDYNFGDISLTDLTYRLNQVIENGLQIVQRQFDKNKIKVLYGDGHFESANIIVVKDTDGKISHRIKSEYAVIATGSKPRNPNNIPFDNVRILDSTSLLTLDSLPKKMIVLGGGIIGSEYASFFAALGTEVIVLDKKEHMLPRLDREVGTHLQVGLSNLGLKFLPSKQAKTVELLENLVRVNCDDGSIVEADVLLFALGRESNVDELGINNANLNIGSKGYISVNSNFETSVPNIYAVGDVIGGASLASTSMEQGRLAALKICGEDTHPFPELFPVGIYTIPEISCCGYTEEEVKAKGFKYEIGRAYYYEMAATDIYGSDNMGVFKIIFHIDTLEILGVHIVGRGATEVIHIGQVAMAFHAKIDFFIDQIFNYPTYAEGYRIAALNGYNKIKRLRKTI